LTPKFEKLSDFVQKKFNTGNNPVDFVFHGGSGSLEEIREGISYGVIKMIDTDLQFAFTEGIRDYMVKNIDYLKTQIGNPEGADIPNKYYDEENGSVKAK
jgi:fructose-bisphosphate aldolase class II